MTVPLNITPHVVPNVCLGRPRMTSVLSRIRSWNRIGWKRLQFSRASGQPTLANLVGQINGATSIFDSLDYGVDNLGILGLNGSNLIYLTSQQWFSGGTEMVSFFNEDYIVLTRVKNQTGITLVYDLVEWTFNMAAPFEFVSETVLSTGNTLGNGSELTMSIPDADTVGHVVFPFFTFQERPGWSSSTETQYAFYGPAW